MANTIISVDLDEVAQVLKRLTEHISNDGVLPSSSQMQQVTGTGVGAAERFDARLRSAALDLSHLVDEIRVVLRQSHDAIHHTVTELVARDATLAKDAQQLLAGLDAMSVDTAAAGAAGAEHDAVSVEARAGLG